MLAGEPHRVRQVYLYSSPEANHWVDIRATIEQKVAALQEHASQMGDWDPSEPIKARAAAVGEQQGLAYAERFRVIRLVRDEGED